MAKTTKDPAQDETVEGFTDRVCKEVAKDYGEGVIVGAEEVVDAKPQIISISPSMDMITGGIREGSWVSIGGQPKTTKTNLALQIAANAQKPENGSRQVYYAKVEGRLSEAHFKGIEGLDTSKLLIIQSTEDKILTAQDWLRIFTKILKTVKGCVLIIDAISALVDEREMEGGVGTETRGSGAKLTSQWVATMANVVPVMKQIVIGITHLYANTGGGMGPKYLEKGSRRFTYQADYLLRTITKAPWPPEGKQIGFKVTWQCNQSTLMPPGGTIESFVRFGLGIDRLYEMFLHGTACGLIEQKGSWYNLSFLGDKAQKAQGGEAIYRMLKDNPEWAKLLEKKLVEFGAGLVGASAE